MFSIENWLFFSSNCWNNSANLSHNLRFFIFKLPIYYYSFYWLFSKQVVIASEHWLPSSAQVVTSTWLGSNCLMWASSVFLPATGVSWIFSPVPLSWREEASSLLLRLLETPSLRNSFHPLWTSLLTFQSHGVPQPFSFYWDISLYPPRDLSLFNSIFHGTLFLLAFRSLKSDFHLFAVSVSFTYISSSTPQSIV